MAIQYIGLREQGFFEPFEALQRGLAQYGQNRREKERLRIEEERYKTEQERQKRLDEQNQKLFDQNLKLGDQNFQLGTLKLDELKAPLPEGAKPTRIERGGTTYEMPPAKLDFTQIAPPGFRVKNVAVDPRGQQSVNIEPIPSAEPLQVVDTPEGKLYFRGDQQLSPPKAVDGLKELTQTENARLEAINQAERDLQTIQQVFKGSPDAKTGGVSDVFTGPFVGRVRQLNPYDNDARLLDQAINAAVPNLARGVFREVGVLTDEDVARYRKQFPTLADPPDIRDQKLAALRARLVQSKQSALQSLQQARRDLTGYGIQPMNPGAPAVTQPETPPSTGSSGTDSFKPRIPVKTKAEFDALPPGTLFEFNGKFGVKK